MAPSQQLYKDTEISSPQSIVNSPSQQLYKDAETSSPQSLINSRAPSQQLYKDAETSSPQSLVNSIPPSPNMNRDLLSLADSAAPKTHEAGQHTSHIVNNARFESPSKPRTISTLLHLGLNTSPDRNSTNRDLAAEKDPASHSTIPGTFLDVNTSHFGIPLPSIPIISNKARRPSAIIRNVTGSMLSMTTFLLC